MLPTACPKPAYGTAKLATNERRTKRTTRSKNVKEQAKVRDGRRCRFPGCQMQRQGFVLDGAHIEAAGMGGNPDESRMTSANILAVCRWHHVGAFSLHSGHIKVFPQTSAGADGLCDWFVVDEQEQWTWIGVS